MDENHYYIFTKGKTNDKQMIKLFFWNFLFSFSDKKKNNIELNDFTASKKLENLRT